MKKVAQLLLTNYYQILTQNKLIFLIISIPKEKIPWIEKNFPNITTVPLGKGTHFIQEDYPHEIGETLHTWYTQKVKQHVSTHQQNSLTHNFK